MTDRPLQPDFDLRPLTHDDREAYAQMLYRSFNTWYARRGWSGDYFRCPPREAGIFFDIYDDLTPGCSVAAFENRTGRLAGACFYHPRERHFSLGIMSVAPEFFGRGVARGLVGHIVRRAAEAGAPAVRLVGSAMNMDSLSLYSRSGFVARQCYHDMVIAVPERGLANRPGGLDRVRPAREADVAAMSGLELAVSGIVRELDYRYAIRNPRGVLGALVVEDDSGGIAGFAISVEHPALAMIGPLVARTEADAIALLAVALERFRGGAPLLVVPMDKRVLLETLYTWGGRNVETHLFQVRGEFQPFSGVNLPSFLPETG